MLIQPDTIACGGFTIPTAAVQSSIISIVSDWTGNGSISLPGGQGIRADEHGAISVVDSGTADRLSATIKATMTYREAEAAHLAGRAARLKAFAAAHKRNLLKNGRITVDGLWTWIDDQTATAVALKVMTDKGSSVNWKCADGVFRLRTAAQMGALSDAIEAARQAAFDAEAAALVLIDQGTLTTVQAVAASGWPQSISL
jgi:hypothetical protein